MRGRQAGYAHERPCPFHIQLHIYSLASLFLFLSPTSDFLVFSQFFNMNPLKVFQYKPLSSEEKLSIDEESDSNPDSEIGLLTRLRKSPSTLSKCHVGMNLCIIFNVVIFLFSGLMFVTGLKWHLSIESKCFEVANFYSAYLRSIQNLEDKTDDSQLRPSARWTRPIS